MSEDQLLEDLLKAVSKPEVEWEAFGAGRAMYDTIIKGGFRVSLTNPGCMNVSDENGNVIAHYCDERIMPLYEQIKDRVGEKGKGESLERLRQVLRSEA